jgi:hypothetical protein
VEAEQFHMRGGQRCQVAPPILAGAVQITARASHPHLVTAPTTREMPRGPGRSTESLRPP